MTTPTTLTAARPSRRLVTFVPDDSRRGRLNAAAFASIVFYGLAFPMAVVLPGAALLGGEAAALLLAIFAAGRLTGAHDRARWLRSAAWSVGAVVLTAVAIGSLFAVLAWGPIAP